MINTEDIRQLVREVLRDNLPRAQAQGTPVHGTRSTEIKRQLNTQSRVDLPVNLTNDADLKHLVDEVIALSEDPDLRSAVKDGRLRFRLTPSGGGASSATSTERNSVFRFDTGVLNENQVDQIAKSYGRIVVGKRAVVTPLARDKARVLKIPIEKVKP
ncbi:MAG: hypothetical protein OES46_18705 [Gammaproteobacteria bacterium]|nr:hypothetical protein [Gammaproteobacteria bacterium]